MNMLPVNLQIRFDDPVMTIRPPALKQKCVRPRSPGLIRVEMTLGATDRSIDQGDTAGETDAARPRKAFEEFTIR